MAAFLSLDQEAGVCNDNLHLAWQWSTMCMVFCSKARLEPAKSWKDVLSFRKNWQRECLGVASVITFASSHISRSPADLGMTLVEGYVHSDANILFGSLKRWLPKNHWELPELLEIEFEAILPGRKQLDQRYTKHPVIRKNFSTKPVRGMSLRKLLCLAQIWHQ